MLESLTIAEAAGFVGQQNSNFLSTFPGNKHPDEHGEVSDEDSFFW